MWHTRVSRKIAKLTRLYTVLPRILFMEFPKERRQLTPKHVGLGLALHELLGPRLLLNCSMQRITPLALTRCDELTLR